MDVKGIVSLHRTRGRPSLFRIAVSESKVSSCRQHLHFVSLAAKVLVVSDDFNRRSIIAYVLQPKGEDKTAG